MSPVARFGPLTTLPLGLVLLLRIPPMAAQDQTCDHLISTPGTTTGTITISASGHLEVSADWWTPPSQARRSIAS
jgi:hypothetical protein